MSKNHQEHDKKEEEIKIEDAKRTQSEENNEVEVEVEEVKSDASEKEAQPSDADKLTAAEDKITELQDKYLRQVAEFDNYRKRTMKEKAELILNGGEKVMSALLPVLDDMDRALKNMKEASDVATLREGVELIFQKMEKTLEGQGLKRMDAVGQPFDTDFHEAIAMIPASDEDSKGKVIDCVQSGYTLNEKVIRHAKVAVGQ